MFHSPVFSIIKSVKVNVFLALPFKKRSPLVYGLVHTIPVSAIWLDMGYYYTESEQCQDTVYTAYNANKPVNNNNL